MKGSVKLYAVGLVICALSIDVGAAPKNEPPGGGEKRFEELAQQIPGFAGLYYSEGNKINVNLVGTAGAAAARVLFGEEVKLHFVEYNFRQLKRWRDGARPALALPGLVYLDLDEFRNRIVFGIRRDASASERAALLGEVEARGVPYGAVIVEDTDPVVFAADLTDDIRPQPGGVQIEFYPDSGATHCSLGFNVYFEAGAGFITCSHCTANQGEENGDSVGWGLEERDPPYWSGGLCPSGRLCRYSDSALIYYAFVSEQGASDRIARTTQRGGGCPSSTTISSTSPRLITRGTQGSPIYGQDVDKIGRTTGWTYGDVDATCIDVNSDGSFTMLCQHRATIPIDLGDSGAPVFEWDSGDGATLVGLIWGRHLATSCGSAYFSDLDSIDYEVGPMTIDTCPTC